MLESYFLSALDKLQSVDEVRQFWNKSQNLHCINQRRHSIFDSFFRKLDYATHCKQKLEKAVQAKFASMETIKPCITDNCDNRFPNLYVMS